MSVRRERVTVKELCDELPLLALTPQPTKAILDQLAGGYDATLGRIIAFAAGLTPEDGTAISAEVARAFCNLVKSVSPVKRALAQSTAWLDVAKAMQLPSIELDEVYNLNDGTGARMLVGKYCRELGRLLLAAERTLDKTPITDFDIERAIWFCRRGSSVSQAMRALMVNNTYGTQLKRIEYRKDNLPTVVVATALQHLMAIDAEDPPRATTPQIRDDTYAFILPRTTLDGLKTWIATFPPQDDYAMLCALTSALMIGSVPRTVIAASLPGFGPPPLAAFDNAALKKVYEDLKLAPDKPRYLDTLHAAMGANAPDEATRITAATWHISEERDGDVAAAIIMHGGGMMSPAGTAEVVGFTLANGHAEALPDLEPVLQAMTQQAVDLTFERLTLFHANLLPGADAPPLQRPEYYRLLAETFGPEQGTASPTRAAVDAAYVRVGFVGMRLVPQMAAAVRYFSRAFGPPSDQTVCWTALSTLLTKVREALRSKERRLLRPPPPAIAELMDALGADRTTKMAQQWYTRFSEMRDRKADWYAGLFA